MVNCISNEKLIANKGNVIIGSTQVMRQNYMIHQNEIKCKLIESHGVSILMDTGDTFYGDSFQDKSLLSDPARRCKSGTQTGK